MRLPLGLGPRGMLPSAVSSLGLSSPPSCPPPQQVGAAGQGRGGPGGGAAAGTARWGPGQRPIRTVGEPAEARPRLGWSNRARAPAPRPQTKGRRAPSASVSDSLLALFLLPMPSPPGVPWGFRELGTARTGLPGSLCTSGSPDP